MTHLRQAIRAFFSLYIIYSSNFSFAQEISTTYQVTFQNLGRNVTGKLSYRIISPYYERETYQTDSIYSYTFEHDCTNIRMLRFDPDDVVHYLPNLFHRYECSESPHIITVSSNLISDTRIPDIIESRQLLSLYEDNLSVIQVPSIRNLISSIKEERIGAAAYYAAQASSELFELEETNELVERLSNLSTLAALYAITEYQNTDIFFDISEDRTTVTLTNLGIELINEFQNQQILFESNEWDENSLRRVMLLEGAQMNGVSASGVRPLEVRELSGQSSRYFPRRIPSELEANDN